MRESELWLVMMTINVHPSLSDGEDESGYSTSYQNHTQNQYDNSLSIESIWVGIIINVGKGLRLGENIVNIGWQTGR